MKIDVEIVEAISLDIVMDKVNVQHDTKARSPYLSKLLLSMAQ